MGQALTVPTFLLFPSHNAGLVRIGSYASWLGFGMCWFGMSRAYKSWFLDPANRREAVRAFKETKRQSGKVDWTAALHHHPGTISEMIGDVGSAQGGVAKALAFPGLILALVGNVLLYHGEAESFNGSLFRFFRAICAPVGLMMVLLTPVYQTYRKDVLAGRVQSEKEEEYQKTFGAYHGLGFSIGILITILLEVPLNVRLLYAYFFGNADAALPHPWPLPAQMAWLTLVGLRLLAFSGVVVSLKKFMNVFQIRGKTMEDAAGMTEEEIAILKQPTFNFECWLGEFNVLILGCCGLMATAATSWVAPGQSYSLADTCAVSGLLALNAFLFLNVELKWFFCLLYVKTIDFGKFIKEGHWEKSLGPVMLGLNALTKEDLVGIRAVQAGHPEAVGIGARHPKVRQLLLCPSVYANVKAFEMNELDTDDLAAFGGEFAEICKVIDSADTLYVPFGPQFKFNRKLPYVRLSCNNHAAEMTKIFGALKGIKGTEKMAMVPNDEDVVESPDEIAYDITTIMLKDQDASFLSKKSIVDVLPALEFKTLVDRIATLVPMKPWPGGVMGVDPVALKACPSFEVQFRGIKAPSPTIVLRMRRNMIAPWPNLSEVPHFPASMKIGAKKKQ